MKHIRLYFLLFTFYFLLVPAYAQVEGDTLIQVEEDTLTVDEIDALLSDDEPEKDTAITGKSETPVTSVVSVESDKSGESAVMMSFVRYKVNQSPDSLYFNILKIKNNTDDRISGTVNINIPEGWKLISRAKNRVRVAPGKSAYIPVRVALSRDAKGGVGYVINASMIYKESVQNRSSEQLLRTDCYVSIPRISKWKIHIPKRVIYFNKQVEYAKFNLYLENKGNAEELIRINFKIGEALAMYGAEGRTYVSTLSLRPNSDTVVVFSVKHIPLEDDISIGGWRGAAINIKASGSEKTETAAIWFRYLESSFTSEKNGGITPLTLEVTATNLLAAFKPNPLVAAYGNILFPKSRNIDYYFFSSNIVSYGGKSGSEYSRALWQQSRMLVNYNTKNARITLGDISAGLDQVIYGRGIGGSYTFKNNTISAAAVRNPYIPINGAAIKHELKLKKGISIRSGLNYENNDYDKINSASGAAGVRLAFLKVHRLNTLFGISSSKHFYNDSTFKLTDTTFVETDAPDTTLSGFGYSLDYSSKINKFQIYITNRYGSKNHQGTYKGRFELIGQAQYYITSKYYTQFTYTRFAYNPAIYRRGILLPENSYKTEIYNLQFITRINPKTTLYTGPVIENLSRKRYDLISKTIVPLSTFSGRLSVRLNYRGSRYNIFIPYLSIGYTKITEFSDSAFGGFFYDASIFTKPYYNARVGVNVRRQHWGVNVYYYYGPYNILDQSAYFYGGNFHRSLRILPWFEKYFLNKKVKLFSYNSYFYDAHVNSERINLNARLGFFFDKGWSLYINNNISLYSRYDDETGDKISSRSYYIDIGFKKKFDIPQPRVKYYDLKVIFYKDLNGNRAMDDNEGGLDYILVKIERDDLTDTIAKPPGKFAYIELISDQFGEINYYNIPEGNYKITILPLRNIKDLYNINGAEQRIIIKNNTTFYVPFVQANKVTGKIVLVRDEFSSEGTISIADIRITATDSAGNTYSTLTDRQGKFMLFVPQTGRTVVRVNNIFGENFQILQDEFTVDFDGFREFEIMFKFKEKPRGINIRGGDLPPGRTFRDRDVNGEEESPTPVPDTPEEPTPSPAEPVPGTETTPETGSPLPEVDTEGGLSAPSITWEETTNYIVLSSFNNRENAQQFLNELRIKDNALIVTTPKGMFRVVYGYRTEKEARDDLEKRRSDFPTAWISKKQ